MTDMRRSSSSLALAGAVIVALGLSATAPGLALASHCGDTFGFCFHKSPDGGPSERSDDFWPKPESPWNLAVDEYNAGVGLQRAGRWQEAGAYFRQALRRAPTMWQAHLRLGYVLGAQRRYGEAESALRDAIRHSPGRYEYLAYFELTLVLYQQKRLSEAESAIRGAIRSNGRLADLHNILGILLWHLRRHPDAEQAFLAALRVDPKFADATVNLDRLRQYQAQQAFSAWWSAYNAAKSLSGEGSYAEAERRIKEAAARAPNDQSSASLFSEIMRAWTRQLIADGKFGEAVALYRRYAADLLLERIQPPACTGCEAVARRPDWRAPTSALVAMLLDHGDRREAARDPAALEQLYRQVLQLDSASAPAHAGLALVFLQRNERRQAEAAARKALRLDPKNAKALGVLAALQGRPTEESIAAYRRVLEHDPANAAALAFFVRHGDPNEVVRAYHAAIASGVSDDVKRSFRDALVAQAGAAGTDRSRAEAIYQGLVSGEKHAEGLVDLGNMLQTRGRLAEAETAYRAALERQPNHGPARTNLGLVLEQRGKPDEALTAYGEAIRLNPGNRAVRDGATRLLAPAMRASAAAAARELGLTPFPPGAERAHPEPASPTEPTGSDRTAGGQLTAAVAAAATRQDVEAAADLARKVFDIGSAGGPPIVFRPSRGPSAAEGPIVPPDRLSDPILRQLDDRRRELRVDVADLERQRDELRRASGSTAVPSFDVSGRLAELDGRIAEKETSLEKANQLIRRRLDLSFKPPAGAAGASPGSTESGPAAPSQEK